MPCLGKDRGFESLHPRHLNTGEVAQKVEHWSENPGLSPVRFRSSPPSFCPMLTPLKRPDLLRFNLGAIFNLLQKRKPMRLHHQSLEQFVKMQDLTPNQFLKGYAEKHLWPDIVYVYQHQFSVRLSIDRGPVRLWRACPPFLWLTCPPSFLSAVFVAEWRSGGLEGLSAVIMADLPAVIMAGWPEFFGEEVIVARIKI